MNAMFAGLTALVVGLMLTAVAMGSREPSTTLCRLPEGGIVRVRVDQVVPLPTGGVLITGLPRPTIAAGCDR